MSRNPNRYGGGAHTNETGLLFEQTTSLNAALLDYGYDIVGEKVFRQGNQVGLSVPKHDLYSKFLLPKGIRYSTYNSKKWLPDECYINPQDKIAFIIEKKFQHCNGSVDEKLPSCHFKKLEYQKLFNPLNYDVVFLYVFNDWFRQDKYRDTLEYIEKMGCYYFFDIIPFNFLGL